MKNVLKTIIYSRPLLLTAILAIIMIGFSFASPYFLTVNNILGTTQFGAVLALVSMGQAVVWLAGGEGIDLSVGTIVSLSGVTLGLAYKAGLPFGWCIVVALATGLLCGMINGILCAVIKLPALIGTLGTSFIYGSLALYLTRGMPISGFPDNFKYLSLKATFGIPNQVLFLVIPITIIAFFVIKKTKTGRILYLVGTSEKASRFATINGYKVRFNSYLLSGFLSGLGGIIMCSWLMTARANVGDGLDMQSITVVALAGISVTGGKGEMLGVVLGILVIIYMESGLDMCGINSIWKLFVQGFLLIFAVALNQYALQKKID